MNTYCCKMSYFTVSTISLVVNKCTIFYVWISKPFYYFLKINV